MTEPMIEIKFKDGSIWQLPVRVVAHEYAAYHSERDFRDGDIADKEKAYADEFEFMLTDTDYMLDYFRNNMDWNEFAEQLVPIKPPTPDYAAEWYNAEMKVRK